MAVDPEPSPAPRQPTPGGGAQGGADELWAAFLAARRDLAEVMTDDELREFGFNLEVLDQRP